MFLALQGWLTAWPLSLGVNNRLISYNLRKLHRELFHLIDTELQIIVYNDNIFSTVAKSSKLLSELIKFSSPRLRIAVMKLLQEKQPQDNILPSSSTTYALAHFYISDVASQLKHAKALILFCQCIYATRNQVPVIATRLHGQVHSQLLVASPINWKHSDYTTAGASVIHCHPLVILCH